MGLDLKIYTYEEFCKRIESQGNDVDAFINRCRKLIFKPKFVVTWNTPHSDISSEISRWYYEEIFLGHVNKAWLCQIEFEREEDVVAFKLRWM